MMDKVELLVWLEKYGWIIAGILMIAVGGGLIIYHLAHGNGPSEQEMQDCCIDFCNEANYDCTEAILENGTYRFKCLSRSGRDFYGIRKMESVEAFWEECAGRLENGTNQGFP